MLRNYFEMRERGTKVETLYTLQATNSRIRKSLCLHEIDDTLGGGEEAKGVPCPVVSLRLFAQLIAFADGRQSTVKLIDQLKM